MAGPGSGPQRNREETKIVTEQRDLRDACHLNH